MTTEALECFPSELFLHDWGNSQIDVVNPQTHEVLQVLPSDLRPTWRPPRVGHHPQAVFETFGNLPGAVLSTADRNKAVVSAASFFYAIDKGPEFGLAPLPVDLRSGGEIPTSAAHAFRIDPDIRPRIRRNAFAAVFHAFCARKIRALTRLKRNLA